MTKSDKVVALTLNRALIDDPVDVIGRKAIEEIILLLEESAQMDLAFIPQIYTTAKEELEKPGIAEAIGVVVNDAIKEIKNVVGEDFTEDMREKTKLLRRLRYWLAQGCFERHYEDWMNSDDDPDLLGSFEDALDCLCGAIFYFMPIAPIKWAKQ